MQQGSRAGLATRTAGMTDEQILDLEAEPVQTSNAGVASQGAGAAENALEDSGDVWETLDSPTHKSNVETPLDTDASRSGKNSQEQSSSPGTRDEPAWLKQLETQPGAAAEARQWRDAAKDVAALDAAYFSGDPGARSTLATKLYDSNPAAFRDMLAESARMLASRDPQALAELARELGMNEAAQNAPAKSLTQAARSPEASAAQDTMSGENRGGAGFPAEAFRAFESATNQDVARTTRDAIDRTLSTALPEGIAAGARRRIGDDIFQELHATLSADRELSRQVGEMLRGWQFDRATRQQVASLISGRARSVMPEVARRVVAEWTSSVLASDRARTARVDAAASRRDITGGRLPEPVPAGALRPKNLDYGRLSDEQILDL
jgi:hypothetical protein